jgi:hypothetical protein
MLVRPTLSDAGTIYAVGNEVAATPASNLQVMQPKVVWESSGLATLNFAIDLGAGGDSWDTVGLYWTNASASATVQIERDDNSGFASPTDWKAAGTTLLAPGQANRDRAHGFWTGASNTDQYVRITVTDGSNPDGFFRAGRVFVGKAFQPALNVMFGAAPIGFRDFSPVTATGSGESVPRRVEVVPTMRFTMQAEGSLAEKEFYDNHYEIAADVGGSKDLFVMFDPDDATYGGLKTVHGLLQPLFEASVPRYQRYEATYQITSLS